MKIIIDIPEEDYAQLDKWSVYYFREIISKGTVLPKGHGDLIDRKALINNGIQKGFCDWYDEIKYAPTIIEADKGE